MSPTRPSRRMPLRAMALAAAAAAALAGCASGPRPPARPALSTDGRAAIIGGESWRTPPGVAFFERGEGLFLVSLVPGSVFEVAVLRDARGRPVVPPDAPFEVKEGLVVLRDRALPPTARLVDTGQLYRHDDHFHLTHRWENADWKALYRIKDDSSEAAPGMRQVAAYLLAALLDQRLPGSTEQATAAAMRRMDEVVARARRAVDAALPSRQIVAMVLHDFEILEEGRVLAVEGRLLKAGPGVKFTYCGDHFHVEQAEGAWTHPIALGSQEPGRFELPRAMFYEEVDGIVAERAGETPWRELLAKRQIRHNGEAWFLGEDYPLAAFARLQKAATDVAAPAAPREAARRSVLDFLRVRLDVSGDDAFRAQLTALDAGIEARWRELEPQLVAPRGRR